MQPVNLKNQGAVSEIGSISKLIKDEGMWEKEWRLSLKPAQCATRMYLFFVNIFMGSVQKYTKIYKTICTNMPTFNKNQIMDNLASLSSNSFPSILFWNKSQTVSTRLFYFNIITELLSQLKNLITNFLSKIALNVTLRY